MTRHAPSCGILVLVFAFCLSLLTGSGPARAQGMPGLAGPLSSIGSLFSGLRSAVEGDMPGLTNPAAPVVFTPAFRGEVRGRPLYVSLSGTVTSEATGQSIVLGRDVSMLTDVVVFETMARAQLGRLSFRIQNDCYITGFLGENIRLDWPIWLLGADFDIVNRPALRVGVNADWSPFLPSLSFSDIPLGTYKLRTEQPVSAGLHATFNGLDLWGLSPSLETRFGLALTKKSKWDEVEVAAGLKGPETVLGSMALRGGWRGSWLKMTDKAFTADITWSGLFGELVYYY